nr:MULTISPECIES: DUF1173 domain-containing protein [Streptomyces]
MFTSTELLEKARRAHRAVLATTSPAQDARRVGLFLVSLSPKDYLIVEDLAVMLTNRAYIPADSSHEITMADALAAAGRSYLKPLRYDTTTNVFPDFVLTDHPAGPV